MNPRSISFKALRQLMSECDQVSVLKTETIKRLSFEKGIEKVTLLLKGCYIEKDFLKQLSNFKIVKVNAEFPLMIDADIEVTVKDVCNEGYLENLKIML